jgi:RNA polymerase sigma-70 factor (ECF subfamily)
LAAGLSFLARLGDASTERLGRMVPRPVGTMRNRHDSGSKPSVLGEKIEPIPVVAPTAVQLRIPAYIMSTRRSHVPLSLVVGTNPRATSDGDLARGLVAGETWAISETWHRFAPMVLVMAERALGSRAEADDVGQEVFHHVFRKAKTLRDPGSLRSFVYSFAVRELKSELRRKRLRSWLSFHQPEELVDLGWRTSDVETRDLLRKCHALLDRLTPRDRLVFTLRRMESMTVEEIATAMDISLSTVKRSMAHAVSRLSRWIDADPGLADLLDAGRWER